MTTTAASHFTAANIADAPRVDTPEKSLRVSRCIGCGTPYAWKGSAPRPGCPACGGALTTTTRRLRAEFVILEGDVLTLAERGPEGLLASIAWEHKTAADLRGRITTYEAGIASGECEMDEGGTAWTMRAPYDYEIARGVTGRRRSSGLHLDRCRAHADRHDAKAAAYERRLAKLGGPLA